MLNNIKRRTKAMLRKILHDEKGEVNIVAMVILIGIAVVLAIIFRDAIANLITTMLDTITNNATNAISGP